MTLNKGRKCNFHDGKVTFFMQLHMLILKCTWNSKIPIIPKAILKKYKFVVSP